MTVSPLLLHIVLSGMHRSSLKQSPALDIVNISYVLVESVLGGLEGVVMLLGEKERKG